MSKLVGSAMPSAKRERTYSIDVFVPGSFTFIEYVPSLSLIGFAPASQARPFLNRSSEDDQLAFIPKTPFFGLLSF